MLSVTNLALKKLCPRLYSPKGYIGTIIINSSGLIITSTVSGVLAALCLSGFFHFSALYALIPVGAIPFLILDIGVGSVLLYYSRKKSIPVEKEISFIDTNIRTVVPKQEDSQDSIEFKTKKEVPEKEQAIIDKYNNFGNELKKNVEYGELALIRLNVLMRIELVVAKCSTTAELIAELKKEGWHGYTHLNEWEGQEEGLISNLHHAFGLLEQAFETADFNAIAKALASCNPCIHGVSESLQALLLADKKEILEVTVNLDPKDNTIQRVTEFVRVYKNVKTREYLEAKKEEINKESLDKVSNDDNFLAQYMKCELILAWCKEKQLIGPSTNTVKNSDPEGPTKVHLEEDNTKILIQEVLKLLYLA